MSRRNRYLWIVSGVAIAFVAIPIAMSSIVVAPERLYPGGATPGGYTRSLILFVLPVTAYLIWFAITKRKDRRRRTPFLITIGIIAVAWTVLDTFLARSFFTFPDPDATIGFNIPGWDPETGWGLNVPIEELLFYVLGALGAGLRRVRNNVCAARQVRRLVRDWREADADAWDSSVGALVLCT